MTDWTGTQGTAFVSRTAHRQWLMSEALGLLRLFQSAAFNPDGGFFTLDTFGKINPPADAANGNVRALHDTTRMVHCFCIAHLIGVPGAERFIDHGMTFIRTRHHDAVNGGYFWAVDNSQAVDPHKQAYGHAFVMLAAASAHMAGHPDASALLDDAKSIINTRFWDSTAGATTEQYTATWQPLDDYRGQNSNMHLTEALMAAFDATGDTQFLSMAESIAALIINRHAKAEGWRVPEHFDNQWQVDRGYAGDPMFRPAGTTPGHALEWSRLLVQLWETGQRQNTELLDAAKALYNNAVNTAWDTDKGGFYYTLDWNDQPDITDRYWWPCAEGIAAAAVLTRATEGDPVYELWYRRIWGFVNNHFIDHESGGWHPELDDTLLPANSVFTGKPDLYHALQACLIPLLPGKRSITYELVESVGRIETGGDMTMSSPIERKATD